MSLLNTLLPSLNRTPATTPPAEQSSADLGQTLRPSYTVNETADAYAVTVQLPGVAKEGLDITAEDGQIRIVGRRAWKQPTGWTALHRETADAAYELVLTHDNSIDVEKVAAELTDGVLRVSFPKAEAAKPRKITVA